MPNNQKTANTFRSTPLDEIFSESSEVNTSLQTSEPTSLFDEPEAAPETEPGAVEPMAIDRVFNEIARGANRTITDGGPIGLSPERAAELRRRGLFNSEEESSSLPREVDQLLVLPRAAIEVLVRNAFLLAQLPFRTRNAISEGLISGVGQTMRELGSSPGMANRLERDLRMIDQKFGRGRFSRGFFPRP